ncbi:MULTISPECIES: Dps family protein [Anoxybacillus]|uniref:DNA-binding ferritin-like protein (Oxidative damage protectant) n=2 Tax=Anoxybacillus TaxID=150247 RepID=B7GK29_ANOFW|nr:MULTISPECIES: Dps family protein [Anoxybacillus]AST06378.1 DNA starvation/stationary phase protection protein [Anoxybacillus flavithermus]MCG3086266.1 DNA starvation/stationary phase protection protein [Anoxybacillus sp. LAT27]MCG6173058.1 DNA starvation/stationary phase protection protein [Anoxybacillus sp. LAT_11]MCG6173751.1 DNA starvation/stationary phase protection protein [Anoxybacillus sp. LAT_31]MCG6178095.1 DNA starvation/stationary phase protection protein [Anoxybacillus sp. LAT_3
MKEKLIDIVNKQIANWNVLYVKLHNYHWYVKGPQFFTLHTKFEELYNEAALHIDELAERLLALGGKPLATMKDYLAVASVHEAKGNETAEEMVAEIVRDFETMIEELKAGMDYAGEIGDETTGDMLLGIHQSLEKHVWMLKSFLG